jgi:hypothetical protein
MITKLPDGRIFETTPILTILYDANEPVYKYTFTTIDRSVKSSARHNWVVWNKLLKDVDLVKMDSIDTNIHELLLQR